MLPAKYRLTKEKDFKKINRSKPAFFSSYFRLKYLANNSALNRFALVVSTKVSKKATKRNQLRRRLREIIRLNRAKIKSGYDIIISASPKALAGNYQELEQAVLSLLAKARLLK